MRRRAAMIMGMALALLLALGGAASAHKVNLFAYAEGGQLKGEGYFPGGVKTQHCPVKVYDATGKLLATAKTDKQGKFSMPLPQGKPPYKLVLVAGEGHQADYSLSAAELGLAPDEKAAAPAPAASAASAPAPPVGGQAALEATLSRLLDQKLDPMRAQLARLSLGRGVTVHDVVAGLGYILGLLGLAAYMRSRQGKDGK